MDIKNSLEEYHKICRVECVNIDAINQSINILMSSNIDYEFRTTLIDEYHNTDNVLKIGSFNSAFLPLAIKSLIFFSCLI